MDYQKLSMELFISISTQPRPIPPMIQRISNGEFKMLQTLDLAGKELSPSELSSQMALSSGRTSLIINSLSEKGFIKRSREGKDRRKVKIALAKSGSDFCEGCRKKAIEMGAAFLSELGEEDAVEFVRLAKKSQKIMASNPHLIEMPPKPF